MNILRFRLAKNRTIARLSMLLTALLSVGFVSLGTAAPANAYYDRIVVQPIDRTVTFTPSASRPSIVFDYTLTDSTGALLSKATLSSEGYSLPECWVDGLNGSYWPVGTKVIKCGGGWDPDGTLVFDTTATATLTVNKVPEVLSYIGPLTNGNIVANVYGGLSFDTTKIRTSPSYDECSAGTASSAEALDVVISPNPLIPSDQARSGSLDLRQHGYDLNGMSIDAWAPGIYSASFSFPASEYCEASNVMTKTLIVTNIITSYTPGDRFDIPYGSNFSQVEYYVGDYRPVNLDWMAANLRNYVAPYCYDIYVPGFFYTPTTDAGTRVSYRCAGGSGDGWIFDHRGAGGNSGRATMDVASADSYYSYSGTARSGTNSDIAVGDNFTFSAEVEYATPGCLATMQYVISPDPIGAGPERIFSPGTVSTATWETGNFTASARIPGTRNAANTRDNCVGTVREASFSLSHHVSVVPVGQSGVLGLAGPSDYTFAIYDGANIVSLAADTSYVPPTCSSTYDPATSTSLTHVISCEGGSADGYLFDVSETALLTLVAPTPEVIENPAPILETGLALEIGGQVAGTPVTFSGSGLEPGSYWEVVVRSTPIVIASGYVRQDGTYSAVAYMPEGLEAGVHRIIWEGTDVDGSPIVSTVYLAIGQDGELLYKSEPALGDDASAIGAALQAAEAAVAIETLAMTGLNQEKTSYFFGIAGLLVALGGALIATTRARRKAK